MVQLKVAGNGRKGIGTAKSVQQTDNQLLGVPLFVAIFLNEHVGQPTYKKGAALAYIKFQEEV